MNSGVLGSIAIFIIFGYFISKVMTNRKNDLEYIIAIIVFIGAIGLVRGTMSYNLKILFFDLAAIGLLYSIIKNKVSRRTLCESR